MPSERFRKSSLGILGKEMARKLGRTQRQKGASVGHEAMQELAWAICGVCRRNGVTTAMAHGKVCKKFLLGCAVYD